MVLRLGNLSSDEPSNIAVWDDSRGHMTGAIVQRVAPLGQVFLLHEGTQMVSPNINYYNYDAESLFKNLRPVSLKPALGLEQSQMDINLPSAESNQSLTDLPDDEAGIQIEEESLAKRRWSVKAERRQLNRQVKADAVNCFRNLATSSSFDSAILCFSCETEQNNSPAGHPGSQPVPPPINPFDMFVRMTQIVRPSGKIVVFCASKDPLLPLYHYSRTGEGNTSETIRLVDVSLVDTWMREYQIEPSRTHPMMNMSASGGFVFSCTVVRI